MCLFIPVRRLIIFHWHLRNFLSFPPGYKDNIHSTSYRLSSPLPIQQNATPASRANNNLISTSSEGNIIMIHLWTGQWRAIKHTHSLRRGQARLFIIKTEKRFIMANTCGLQPLLIHKERKQRDRDEAVVNERQIRYSVFSSYQGKAAKSFTLPRDKLCKLGKDETDPRSSVLFL